MVWWQVFRHTSSNTPHEHNGVWWYLQPGNSCGYAPNSTITLGQADTTDKSSEQRLSLHLCNVGGWRAGAKTSLDNSSAIQKFVYYRPKGETVPEAEEEAEVDEELVEISKAISSPLFSGGVSCAALDRVLGGKVVLSDAVLLAVQQSEQVTGEEIMSSLNSALEEQSSSDELFLLQLISGESEAVTNLVQACEGRQTHISGSEICRALFACIVHHSGLTKQAVNAGAGAASDALKDAWKQAKSLHLALASQRQALEVDAREVQVSVAGQ
jgi:hypothetical protein